MATGNVTHQRADHNACYQPQDKLDSPQERQTLELRWSQCHLQTLVHAWREESRVQKLLPTQAVIASLSPWAITPDM